MDMADREREVLKKLEDCPVCSIVTDYIKSLKESAECAHRERSEFISDMTYKTRSVLNGIIGLSDLLVNEKLSGMQLEYATEIYNAGHGLVSVIEDSLELSRLEAGEVSVERIEYDIAGLLEEIDSIVRPLAGRSGLDFEIVCGDDLPGIILTDGIRLRQCLVNLLDNAVKFTVSGSVRLSVSSEGSGEDWLICFEVKDTGVGISSADRDKIFSPFYQVARTNESMFISSGLGLTISREIVRLLGGRIDLRSEVGRGSSFTVRVPVGVNSSEAGTLEFERIYSEVSPEQSSEESDMVCSGHILLADDEGANRAVIGLLLETMGLSYEAVDDGLAAVERGTKEPFDLILMDIKMPNMDGFEAADILRRRGVSTPIAALTAGVLSEKEDGKIAEIFDEKLIKPVDRSKLFSVVGKYLPLTPKAANGEAGGKDVQVQAVDDGQVVIDFSNGEV
jgi:CheY-like chemotaxis protein